MPALPANIACQLDLTAARLGRQAALRLGAVVSGDTGLDFTELAAEVAAWRRYVAARGVGRGDRVLVMVRPGLPLLAGVFALFGLGAVPVVVDPGMPRAQFLRCVAKARPRVLLGILPALAVSWCFRTSFRGVAQRIRAPSSPGARLARHGNRGGGGPGPVAVTSDELAAVLFTSGSTGAPKGVCYTHGMFAAQVAMLREAYAIQPGEIDLPLLPLFMLFNPVLGVTSVLPPVNPARPAALDPARVLEVVRREHVTSSFGSPTLWTKLLRYAQEHRVALPSLRRLLCAGAAVPPELWRLAATVVPQATLHSPYGATEALPVSTVSSREVDVALLGAAGQGAGACLGRVLPGNTVRIVAPAAAQVYTQTAAAGAVAVGATGVTPTSIALQSLPPGTIGEIVVTGPTVTACYDDLPEATAAAKIVETEPVETEPVETEPVAPPVTAGMLDVPLARQRRIWHRMGDAGYFDLEGRLWFCGRLAERVTTVRGVWHSQQVEPYFNEHPEVRRTALIGLGEPGRQRLALVVEPVNQQLCTVSAECRRLARELRARALAHPTLTELRLFYFHPGFPVDVRHNAKIHRLTLARWAADGAVGYESDPKR